MYGLDTTDVSNWNRNVMEPAVEIVKGYINEGIVTQKPIPLRDVEIYPNALDDTFVCEVCNRVFVGQLQWNIHRKSNKHKKVLQGYQKKREVDFNKSLGIVDSN